MKLNALMIFVPDLAVARSFYCDLLGFEVTSESAERIVLSYANGRLLAFKCEKDGRVGDYAREARSVFVFEVPSIGDSIDDLRRKGVAFLHEAPAQNEWGRYAAFVDPFDNAHELFEGNAA